MDVELHVWDMFFSGVIDSSLITIVFSANLHKVVLSGFYLDVSYVIRIG